MQIPIYLRSPPATTWTYNISNTYTPNPEMNRLSFHYWFLTLLPFTHAVQIIMSNAYSQGTPTEQIWNMVPPLTHCCVPLELQYQGKGGWWRAESVIYNDLPAPSSTRIYGYELWHQQASCNGNPVLSTSTNRGVYRGMIRPQHTALGGAAYRLAGQVGSASHPAIMMYPEFIRVKGTYFEKVGEALGVLRYQSIGGATILGRTFFPALLALNGTNVTTA
ncbi:MAG: hypothetical protein Q9222_000520 [Ikaeria aurantiellina]